MKIEPIDISIKDNWKYGEIAFLVDREDFLKDVKKARKELGVTKLVPYKKVNSWTHKQYEQEIKDDQIKKGKYSRGTVYLMPAGKVDIKIENLLAKYRKPPTFFLPILYSILSGTVTDSEYSITAYCEIIYPEISVPEPKVAIIIHPETKPKEIEKLFKTKIPEALDEYKKYILKTKRIPPDTISNIERDRHWYWLKEKGLSYTQVHKRVEKEGEAITRDGVIKAIKQYKERLAMEL